MKLPTEIFGDVAVVHTPEELANDAHGALESALTGLERACVVVDLDGSETVEGSGLEALLSAQEALRALGGDLKLAVTNNINRKILEMTRLDQQLEVFESVLDAVKSFA
jgi:anti-sigma B factor antagonist